MDQEEQVSVESYDPRIFDRLSLFRTAKTLLSRNKRYIKILGDVIVTHGLHNRVGVSLLHKHFDLDQDEIVVRTIDAPRRVAHARPTLQHTDAMPYLWKTFRDPSGQLRFAPLEFVCGDAQESQVVDLTQYPSFLTGITHALAEHDLLDMFGIATTNIMKIPLGHDELMVETTDSESRTLTITPMHRSDLQINELTETFWTFTPGRLLEGAVKCSGTHCSGHCKSHCSGHCVMHCKDHKVVVSPGRRRKKSSRRATRK
jgi:hypothetical protein